MKNSYMSSALERAMSNSMPELIQDGADQVLTVPIVSRGQRLGAMEFRAPNDKQWNNRSIELAHVIAQRLALALDNIRLFEQAQMIAHREQTASQVSAVLQSKTDLDALVATAADAFQQALGATRTSIRLGMPESTSGQNGSHSS
jgi:GAF domain-containing protein